MNTQGILARERFDELLDALRAAGYRCIGPVVHEGAIQYRDLDSSASLPRGWQDLQAPGQYRLQHGDSDRQFAWANGPQAFKPFLFTPRETLWTSRRDSAGSLAFAATEPDVVPLAVIGARPCDLAALRLQDAHFLSGLHRDSAYAARRAGLFVVVVNCSHPAATCFCVSTGDGPEVRHDEAACDVILDELDGGFAVAANSERGAAIIATLPLRAQTAQEAANIDEQRQRAQAQQRALPAQDLRPLLNDRLEHPQWTDVAARCLSCGNCTSVCPTCFCHSDRDSPALDGSGSVHYREWDSCFTQGHSYIHGITLRADTRLRYRQWLTHKLGAWHDQYGRSGCVGCGRCITWCPVGIDLTAEVAALAASAP